MIVGLTGGIGSGKSKIVTFFKELDVPCYIADDRAKQLMNTDLNIKNKIINTFGKKSYINGVLNRSYIANIVFKESSQLSILNTIVHPAVKYDFQKWLANQNSTYIIKEAAIIFEIGEEAEYDKIILVTTPKQYRLQRIKIRDGSSEKEIEERMSKQWDDEKKINLADYHIENIYWSNTLSQIKVIHNELLLNSF